MQAGGSSSSQMGSASKVQLSTILPKPKHKYEISEDVIMQKEDEIMRLEEELL